MIITATLAILFLELSHSTDRLPQHLVDTKWNFCCSMQLGTSLLSKNLLVLASSKLMKSQRSNAAGLITDLLPNTLYASSQSRPLSTIFQRTANKCHIERSENHLIASVQVLYTVRFGNACNSRFPLAHVDQVQTSARQVIHIVCKNSRIVRTDGHLLDRTTN